MITVDNLFYSYGKDKCAVDGISFAVGKREIFGFLGPNGSGKSTTQKILTGILTDYTGSVEIMGRQIRDWNKRLYNEIGVLFEFPYLYSSLSAVDNLRYFSSFYPRGRRRDVYAVLDRLELKEGYGKKRVSSYSKGMRQRASMARALISTPSLLFLDEPTSGLDPAGAVMFRELIREERARGTTVFITTHNMVDADLLCDRVALISDGEIRAMGTPSGLKTQKGRRQVQIEYRVGQEIRTARMDMQETARGLDLGTEYDEILRIHSVEPTLEDVFIQYTGRGLRP